MTSPNDVIDSVRYTTVQCYSSDSQTVLTGNNWPGNCTKIGSKLVLRCKSHITDVTIADQVMPSCQIGFRHFGANSIYHGEVDNIDAMPE